ncbi:protein MLN51 homolog [Phragmites australis]|uniref:protein MLN51 homolog n=1 Tax=Phragmites australis TaxID=29695 RepID=UPI002D78A01C|nr:protein MLN51 homolog [Phragmites australis]XP_062203940.1 protein MLN51 homolog [Phragmites australis]XP_062203949.1 protein MLN51 homolog [Phragmites australis]
MADPPPPDAQPPPAAAPEPVEVEKAPAAPLTPELDAAAAGVDEEEYVSDPEDAPLPTMRRREASDDEGSEDGRPRARIGPDHDDDGQGAPEAYDDEVDDEEDEEYYDEEEEDVGEGFGGEYGGRAPPALAPPKEDGGGGQGTPGEEGGKAGEEGLAEGEVEGEGEEKEQEPFSVPTSGAFYMHDDRFQEENRGRRRRMFGGRKLWDAKDDQAWVHDRFEEMNLQDERNEDKRMPRGRFRGRGAGGKARGGGRGFPRGGKQHNYHEDGNTQNRPPKVVRGRGPRRYEAVARNNREFVGSQRKQAARFREPAPNAAAARESGQVSHAQPEAAPTKTNAISSSLNSASPPFYPSGASKQEFSVAAQRRDIQAGSNKVLPSSMKMDDNLKLQSGSMVRGRTTMDYVGRDRFHADGPVRSSPGRGVATSLNSSGFTSSSVNPGQSPIVRASEGNSSIGISSNNQVTSSLHQTLRISTQPQSHTSLMHQKSVQVQNKSATRIPTQQLSHRTGNPSPAAQHLPVKSTESGENGSYPSPNNSKTSSAVGKANNQETGRGSFMYGGAQVIGAAGAVGLSQGDQNFPGTPALLPVMQFGGQQPGGLGVPTVGMALPGYVAQQQMGMGNNEMTWLPLLAGAAGAFGGSYPPYIALDPSFYSRPSGQTSSSVPSREPSANRGSKSPPRNDIGNEELDQRQNKPRRYSEMNFSQ